jgi:steroid delta-isomerase-like uncharacterized protein
MSTHRNKQLARRLYDEVLNDGNIAAVDELAVQNYEEHDPLPGQGTGCEGLKERFTMLMDAFKPRFTIEDVIAEDDRVMVRWTNTGTHVGVFLGIPPTGRTVTVAGIDVYRVQDGKLAEHWHVVDQLAMLQQLGVLPQPEEAK